MEKEDKHKFKYKCGHEGEPVILDDNEISMSAYFIWKDSVGYDGDKSMCWGCYCKYGETQVS